MDDIHFLVPYESNWQLLVAKNIYNVSLATYYLFIYYYFISILPFNRIPHYHHFLHITVVTSKVLIIDGRVTNIK